MLRLLAILMMLLQPLATARSIAPASPDPAGAPAACGCEHCCCDTGQGCPCSASAPTAPITPTPAPSTPPTSTPTRLYLPPAPLLFTLAEPADAPQTTAPPNGHSLRADTHARSLARLCVWRT